MMLPKFLIGSREYSLEWTWKNAYTSYLEFVYFFVKWSVDVFLMLPRRKLKVKIQVMKNFIPSKLSDDILRGSNCTFRGESAYYLCRKVAWERWAKLRFVLISKFAVSQSPCSLVVKAKVKMMILNIFKWILIKLHLNLIGFWKVCQEQIWDRHKELPKGNNYNMFLKT